MRPLVDEDGIVRAAVLQMNTGEDVEANVQSALDLVDEAAGRGARLLVLPEKFHYLGAGEGVARARQSLDGPLLGRLSEAAARHEVYLVAGSIWEEIAGETRTYNASVLLGPDGRRLAVYRKIHMFDVEVGGQAYRESDSCAPGDEAVAVKAPSAWPGTGASAEVVVGLTICYDLRFPELYRAVADLGASIVTVPAAFTMTTGRDHWHVLVRARAIENQVYMVAANQTGRDGRGLESYGRSVIVDPWGVVLAQAPDRVGVAVADLDLGYLRRVRTSLPSLANRAPEAYSRRRLLEA